MVMSKFAAIILAAGKGTRMKSSLPKVLHEIAARPMMNYVVANVSRLDPEKIVVVTAPKMEDVKAAVLHENKDVKFAVQKKQLGTGDAVKAGISEVKNKTDIIVLYGDTPFISTETIDAMLRELKGEHEPAVVVLGFVPENPAEYGRLVINNMGELEEIVEYKDANIKQRSIEICNSGVMAISGDLAAELLSEINNKNAKKEFYLTDVVKIARAKGYNCRAMQCDEAEVMGINSKFELAIAENILQARLRAAALELGASMTMPDSVQFSFDTVLGDNVTIEPYVVIGKNVKIDDGSRIRSFSYLEDAWVGKNAIVGPYARLRPGTKLEDGAHIGNFVEVKNSKIGKGAKVNHLSYVGDAEVGKDANIGAGTITCNYDGKKKHKTIIGEGAFIGSNTSLVAPVKIGEKAVIGAGSTIIKDVKKGAKVINKMPQVEIKK